VTQADPQLDRQAVQVEVLAESELKAQGFEVIDKVEWNGPAGTTRYLYAERQLVQKVIVRVSDHRTTNRSRHMFSVVWTRPSRVFELRRWLNQKRKEAKDATGKSCKFRKPRQGAEGGDAGGASGSDACVASPRG